jgi:hypothetical protein
MHPLTMILKIAAEATRASTPQGSTANQVANGIKQGVAFLDTLTANTPAQRAQAVASLLSEYSYAQSSSDQQRIGLTIGNAFLLALEGAQHMGAAGQQSPCVPAPSIAQWGQAYQQQSTQLLEKFQQSIQSWNELQRQQAAQRDAEIQRLEQECAVLRNQIALLGYK